MAPVVLTGKATARQETRRNKEQGTSDNLFQDKTQDICSGFLVPAVAVAVIRVYSRLFAVSPLPLPCSGFLVPPSLLPSFASIRGKSVAVAVFQVPCSAVRQESADSIIYMRSHRVFKALLLPGPR